MPGMKIETTNSIEDENERGVRVRWIKISFLVLWLMDHLGFLQRSRGGSLWNRSFVKGASSRPSCSLSSSERL